MKGGQNVKLIAYLHLVAKLIMLGTTIPISEYTCMAAKGFLYLYIFFMFEFPCIVSLHYIK